MNEDNEMRRGKRPDMASSIYPGKDGRWHGRVTMGILDNGLPDRRHVSSKSEAVVIDKVRILEKARDDGKVKKPGQRWTVAKWLDYWLNHIAVPPNVRQSSHSAYSAAVRKHLAPGLGAHRLEKLEPEHLEKLYVKMQRTGSKPATAHQAHRTLKTALNHALARGYVTQNVAMIARAPKVEEEEIEPYTIEEVQRLLVEADKVRNGARWAIALALGLRQGEALGLKWKHLDLEAGTLRVRRSRQRPTYAHGCGQTCGRKAGYCPQRVQTNDDDAPTKSKAGRRGMGLPAELVTLLKAHQLAQAAEREAACQLWQEGDWVFTTPVGRPLSPNTDYHAWKELIGKAGLRDARLHDARHTAATVLLILEVQQRAVLDSMGWSTDMSGRYQHMTDSIRQNIAKKVDGALWKPKKKAGKGKKKGKKAGKGDSPEGLPEAA